MTYPPITITRLTHTRVWKTLSVEIEILESVVILWTDSVVRKRTYDLGKIEHYNGFTRVERRKFEKVFFFFFDKVLNRTNVTMEKN